MSPKSSGSGPKVTEIKTETITQAYLAELQQTKADAAHLEQRLREGKEKIRLILRRGGTIEPGPLRVVSHGKTIDIM